MTSSPGLRERKKADTRRALSDAALHLAFERGIDNVTREAIAERAGVSLRTFNNYFAGKYEAIAYRQLERMRRSLATFRARPASEPLWTAITEAVLAPLLAEMGEDYAPTRQQLDQLLELSMAIEVRNALAKDLMAEWTEAIAERTGTDPARDMYPRLVAASIRAVAEAAMDTYIAADPPVPIVGLMRRGFADVVAGLPEPKGKSS
ncbi:TetR/AcrR family transcriptional regulator [Mycobacterium sp. shizuoka-1]|uniref:TetR/AcrR family transcriptional regulator n=1 Tax=Mycobacterium sp. shizuoka-1 TaxID=2039281 RepID=UPI000C06351D|nr:TetR family transcriptional regulator [Mycobacterium sp. shizuoka-1]GAY18881.1 TetR family transcriptional regulator [Mycobacterium sp. shizuoka-1]